MSECKNCRHSLHPNYECGHLLAETIYADCSVVDTCACNRSETERKQYLLVEESGAVITFTAAISKVVGDEIELTDVRDYRRMEKNQ